MSLGKRKSQAQQNKSQQEKQGLMTSQTWPELPPLLWHSKPFSSRVNAVSRALSSDSINILDVARSLGIFPSPVFSSFCLASLVKKAAGMCVSCQAHLYWEKEVIYL